MNETNPSYNSKNTSAKEQIRKNLRHALGLRSTQPIPHIDYTSPILLPIDNVLNVFVQNFRSQGGKCKLCDKDEFFNDLSRFANNQQFTSILNTSQFLVRYLKEMNISFQHAISFDQNPDLAIVYADFFIARSGGVVLSQQYSIYPSIRNLAQDVLIVGFASNVLPDLKNVLEIANNVENKQKTFLEIIHPSQPTVNENGEQGYSLLNPRLSLLMIKNV